MQLHCSYLICSTPQSGSMYLSEALKKTGIAGQPEEYFELLRIKTSIEQSGLSSKPRHGPGWSKLWDVRTYAHYLAEVLEEGTSNNGIFGAHVMWDYFDNFVCSLRLIPACGELAVSDLLATVFPNLHYIWVTRRDKVQHAVALWQAFQDEMWMFDDTHPPRIGSAFYSEMIDRLVQQIVTKEEDWWKFFDACHIEPFTVVYEELAHGIESTIYDVLKYLQIPTTNNLACTEWGDRQTDALSEQWVERYRVLKQAQQSRLPA